MKIYPCTGKPIHSDPFPISGDTLHLRKEGIYQARDGTYIVVLRSGNKKAIVTIGKGELNATNGYLSSGYRFRYCPEAMLCLEIK